MLQALISRNGNALEPNTLMMYSTAPGRIALDGPAGQNSPFAAAVLLGVSDTAGKYYMPQVSAFLIYVIVVALLMWRPLGLFGKRHA